MHFCVYCVVACPPFVQSIRYLLAFTLTALMLAYCDVHESEVIFSVYGFRLSETTECHSGGGGSVRSLSLSNEFTLMSYLKPHSRRSINTRSLFSRPFKSKSRRIPLTLKDIKNFALNKSTDLYGVQEELEKNYFTVAAYELYTNDYRAISSNITESLSARRLLSQWLQELTNLQRGVPAIIAPPTRQLSRNAAKAYTDIKFVLDSEHIAIICLQELTRTRAYSPLIKGTPAESVASAIGKRLQQEMLMKLIQGIDHGNQGGFLDMKELSRMLHNGELSPQAARQKYSTQLRLKDATLKKAGKIQMKTSWSEKLNMEIGMHFLYIMVNTLKIGAVPAFQHKVIPWTWPKKIGCIEWSEEVYTSLMNSSSPMVVEPWTLPMLVPPAPWLTHRNGGYLTHSMTCVRQKGYEIDLDKLECADREGRLGNILTGLDVLGQTAWKINNDVLSIVLRLSDNDTLLPQEFDKYSATYCSHDISNSIEYAKNVSTKVDTGSDIITEHKRKCDTIYRVEFAKHLADLTLFMPHSLDFRGRAYPIAPYLNHIGDDLSRGLLLFSRGRALGERGLYWLKVHLANLAGAARLSLDERVAYVDSHLEDIFDSADRPITGTQWWKRAKSPWQCLAACFELTAAMRSADPRSYISHVPCHQDGSCNGLQHYAALGRDVDGAGSVNLSPSDTPKDAYASVAKKVSDRVRLDASTNTTHISNKLVGRINNRDIFKLPVMTSVYGITRFGARKQIEESLKKYDVVSLEEIGPASEYLVDITFDCMKHMFSSANNIQRWLNLCATEIGNAVPPDVAQHYTESKQRPILWKIMRYFNIGRRQSKFRYVYPQTALSWTTPLGFEVTQPYRMKSLEMINTALQRVLIPSSRGLPPVDAKKQAASFPPNFIHSLDATHMFKTAIACHASNISFASVHDCFWTHAADVDAMNHILREQFVDIYSEPVLKSLRSDLLQRYRGFLVPVFEDNFNGSGNILDFNVSSWRPIRIPEIPNMGNFRIEDVLSSQYFFN